MNTISSLLEKHGEKFMARFEPSTISKPSAPKLTRKKSKTSTTMETSLPISEKKSESLTNAMGSKSSSSALDEIEELMMQRRGSSANAVPSATHVDARHTRIPPGIDHKAERRAFMSHRADKIHSKPSEPATREQGGLDREIDASQLSPEEFKKLQLEVEKLGGRALDKKQRKVWHAAFLSRIGAKADKLPRMSAKIGGGIAKKRKEREIRDMALKIESGDIRVKGSGARKKKELSDKGYDRGLQEAGPGFRNGVLRFKLN